MGALKDYHNAIKLKPDFWQAYLGKANVHTYFKQYTQAIVDLTAAIKYAGENANGILYYNRGQALYFSGQYEFAIKHFNTTIEKFEYMDDISLLMRAKSKWMLGNKDEACNDYKQAVLLNGLQERDKEFLDCK